MTTRPKPHVHGRDHEHGGADPTLIHWEDVGTDDGDGGGGGGIEFDVSPQTGGFLDVRTDDTGGIFLLSQHPEGDPPTGPPGEAGDIIISFERYLILSGVPSNVDPGVAGAVWADHGVLRISGYT